MVALGLFMPSFSVCYLVLSTLHLPQATSLSFDFDFSQPGGYNAANFSFQGDAYFHNQVIELTRNDRNEGLDNSLGRASYAQPVPIWDEVTGELASFTTTFSIQILQDNINNHTSGDGMAFFFGHYPSSIPSTSGGSNLGLFSPGVNSTNATGDNRVVAVEFDTFMNPNYDTSDNHMGIDVNSLISKAYTNTSVPGKNLTSGLVMTCRVSYDNSTQRLAADLQIGDASYHVDTSADLRQLLPSVVAIGFSGATGVAVELHRVLTWSFHSTIDGTPPPAPAPSPSSSPAPSSSPSPSPSPAPQGPHGGSFSTKIPWKIIGPITGGAIVVALFAVLLCRRQRGPAKMPYNGTPAYVPRRFDYHELAEATHNFAEEQKLGEGGFATVYRGELASQRRSVAVKKFKAGTSSRLGMKAFEDEIKVISQVRHRNLVGLVGWCNDWGKGRLLLVYELVSEGNLDENLHGVRSWLSWRTRNSIILDLGCALRYLHGECTESVLHGDIKPSNILLDSQYVAKLTDFGLARFMDHGIELRTTQNVAGTPGYVDPDFITTGKRSRESDVYSFGIVLLEIISGRRPAVVDHQTMVTPLLIWIWGRYRRDSILEAADARLRDESTADDHGQMERVLLVGLWCAHPDPSQRPTIAAAMSALQLTGVEIPPLPLPVFMAVGPSSFSANDRSRSSETSDGLVSSTVGRADAL